SETGRLRSLPRRRQVGRASAGGFVRRSPSQRGRPRHPRGRAGGNRQHGGPADQRVTLAGGEGLEPMTGGRRLFALIALGTLVVVATALAAIDFFTFLTVAISCAVGAFLI